MKHKYNLNYKLGAIRKLDNQNRITIPYEIRTGILNAKAGDQMLIVVNDDNTITIKKYLE